MALSNANTPSSTRPMGGKGMSASPTHKSPINTRGQNGKKGTVPFFAKKGSKKK